MKLAIIVVSIDGVYKAAGVSTDVDALKQAFKEAVLADGKIGGRVFDEIQLITSDRGRVKRKRFRDFVAPVKAGSDGAKDKGSKLPPPAPNDGNGTSTPPEPPSGDGAQTPPPADPPADDPPKGGPQLPKKNTKS